VQLGGKAADQVRRDQYNIHGRSSTDTGKWIKGARYSLLKDTANQTAKQLRKLAEVVLTNKAMYRAFLLYGELRYIYRLPKHEAADRLDAWLAWASRSRLKPFAKLARTIRKHKQGVLAAIELGLSNERVSYCTSWCGCGGDALSEAAWAMMTGSSDDVAGDGLGALAAVGRAVLAGVVEVEAASVDPPAGDVPAALPGLDRVGGDAELCGDLIECEHALSAQPVTVGRDAAVLAELGERGDGERFAPAAGQAALVEDLDGLVVGVLVEELLDQRDRRGWRGVLLPCAQWSWQLQRVLLAA
jgi:hypothetical protein